MEGTRSARGAHAARAFKSLASKRTSFFQTIKVIAAIFLAKVRRAIVGRLALEQQRSSHDANPWLEGTDYFLNSSSTPHCISS